jgi:hypothetical protein
MITIRHEFFCQFLSQHKLQSLVGTNSQPDRSDQFTIRSFGLLMGDWGWVPRALLKSLGNILLHLWQKKIKKISWKYSSTTKGPFRLGAKANIF